MRLPRFHPYIRNVELVMEQRASQYRQHERLCRNLQASRDGNSSNCLLGFVGVKLIEPLLPDMLGSCFLVLWKEYEGLVPSARR